MKQIEILQLCVQNSWPLNTNCNNRHAITVNEQWYNATQCKQYTMLFLLPLHNWFLADRTLVTVECCHGCRRLSVCPSRKHCG